jgi:membrane associated rhomboid family serine protease
MKKFPLAEFFSTIKYPLLFACLIWILFLADVFFQLNLHSLGVSPRKIEGAIGIILAPLIHGDLAHISNNTIPMLVLGSLLFYFYKPIAWPVFLWIYFISGLWLWIGGRNSDVIPYYHFGASTLIYGFSTFLFFSGVFRKHKQLMVVSALVVFLYGGISYGIFPFDKTISWEGHLFGAISGILVAYNYRKEGPQAEEYQWPEEEVDLEAIYNQQLEEEKQNEELYKSNPAHQIHITYTIVSEKNKKDEKL